MLSAFPIIDYKFSDGVFRKINNFNHAILVEQLNIHNKLLYKPYAVNETDTPESVSQALYDTPDYWWTILLVNNIINPFTDWIRTTDRISKSVRGHDEILYFKDIRDNSICDDIDDLLFREELEKGNILPEYINVIKRSNYELEKNNEKYKIYVISPEYIYEFVYQYAQLLKKEGYV